MKKCRQYMDGYFLKNLCFLVGLLISFKLFPAFMLALLGIEYTYLV
jgi:hypothetical protein